MSVVVAEEGNRRHGDMGDDEIEQCILDIKSWYERSSNALKGVGAASSASLQRLDKVLDTKIPKSLKFLLSECNGGIWFMGNALLNADEIAETVMQHSSEKTWEPDFIPFAKDGSGSDTILISTKSGIYEWDADDGLGERLAPSFSAFIEEFRNKLLSGHCEFMEDVGVIESVGAGTPPKANRK